MLLKQKNLNRAELTNTLSQKSNQHIKNNKNKLVQFFYFIHFIKQNENEYRKKESLIISFSYLCCLPEHNDINNNSTYTNSYRTKYVVYSYADSYSTQ